MNKRLFLFLYTNTQKNRTLRNIAVLVTTASKFIYIAVYAVYFALLIHGDDVRIVPYIAMPALTLLTARCLRHLLKRQRPFSELEIKALIEHKNVYSFPSNHAASAAVIACAVGYIDTISGVALLVFAVLTGASRVLTGVHYPFDVLAGWMLGLLFGGLGFVFIA